MFELQRQPALPKKPFLNDTHARKRMLVVDDDPIFANILSHAARSRGIDVTVCISVDEFMRICGEEFDCGIVDLNLGRHSPVNGVELVEYIDSMSNDLSVIMVSQTDLAFKRGTVPTKHASRFLSKQVGIASIIDRAVQGGK